jgi:nucleoside-diphosphate-sugar epimerase
MPGSVLILGANGRLGRALVRAFAEAGWQVLAQVRRPPASALPQVKWLQQGLDAPAQLAEAARHADVVVHAVNPAYTAWHTEAVPLLEAGIRTAQALRALLMFPGNVYNFGAQMPPLLQESTPRVRLRMEEVLREAARGGLRVAIVRAGDFFGGPGRGAWFDLSLVKALPQGRLVYPGRTDAPHAWAYIPDLARAFERVAAQRASLPVYEVLHFPGHTLDGETLLRAIERAARKTRVLAATTPLRRSTMPWAFLRVGALFVPMLRELVEMRYLWDTPHRLSGERLTQLIGSLPATPLEQALEASLVELFKR